MKNLKHFTIFVLSLATFSLAWSGHEAYTYLVVRSLPIDVDKLVQITPYTYKETRIYNEKHYYKDDFAGKRKFFDDLGDGVFPPDPEPVDGKLPVWQILTIYAQFPDFGMDEELNLSPLQALIGNSQGVRHMRYKLGPIEAFEGDRSFVHFVNMSREAFKKGDEYWGYRFLSYAIHYLEDLFQPYHNSPGTFWEVLSGLFDKKVMRMLNNAHYTYDNYLLFLVYYSKHAEDVREIIRQTQPRFVSGDPEKLIYEVMMYGYYKFPEVHREVRRAFSGILETRVPSMDDFKKLEGEGKLDKLLKITLDIVQTMTAVLKGFLITEISRIGQTIQQN
ncbi:hypothetical protein [Fervidobacterium thailandense]|uniref:hypothetical protein n=1 Tax=Fervidobacterium thailandense TaxID=1008305 RepID=UPI00084619D9|nr:hypothetical protein [Fervidobacterium thailandense]